MPELNIFSEIQDKDVTKGILVSAVFRGDDRENAEVSLDELERLLDTAGGKCVARMTQFKTAPDAGTYIGSGKLKELAELCRNNDADLVVFDTELSPSQIRNMEEREH